MGFFRFRGAGKKTRTYVFWDFHKVRCALYDSEHDRVRWRTLPGAYADAVALRSPVRPGSLATILKDAVCVLFPIDGGFFIDKVLAWERGHPREPMSVTEEHALLRELGIRAQEAARHHGLGGGGARWAGSDIRSFRFDGHRVLNPVGFSGNALTVHAAYTFLVPYADRFFRAVQHAAPESEVTPLLLDDAVHRLMVRRHFHAAVVCDDRATSVTFFRAGVTTRRSFFNVGQQSFEHAFRSAFALTSDEETSAMLDALEHKTISAALKRRFDAFFSSRWNLWAQGVGNAGLNLLARKDAASTVAIVLFDHRGVFARLLASRKVRRLFPDLRHASFSVTLLHEELGLHDSVSCDDMRFRLALRVLPSSAPASTRSNRGERFALGGLRAGNEGGTS